MKIQAFVHENAVRSQPEALNGDCTAALSGCWPVNGNCQRWENAADNKDNRQQTADESWHEIVPPKP